MSKALTSLWKVRDALPAPTRQAVRRATDPVLAPVGSVAGARPTGRRPALVGLTFDDGPDPDVTPAVLDVLAEAGTRATFFVLVDRANRHPALVRRVVDEGHEIGLHGPDHRRLTTLSAREVRSGLVAAKARLEHLAGTPVHWFRPPFGSQSIATYVAARRAGLMPVVWTAEGEDWVERPATEVADRVVERLRPGGIVLLHDGLAGDPREPEGPDPLHDVRGEIVDEVIDRLAAHGMRGTTIGDLVGSGRRRRSAWFRP
jgi:peptidoglycan/xylan/chitin deacetylase (PgdA/CDA1 family)